MKVCVFDTNEFRKSVIVQYSAELKTVRLCFDNTSEEGEYAGVILTLDKQTTKDLAQTLLNAADHI
jgi:hypothetical protein